MTQDCLLFQATKGGIPVSVVHAEPHELAAICGRIERELSLDVLDPWDIISIRRDDIYGPKLHALGWRTGLANTWITSPLISVDFHCNAVLTGSGKVYSLGDRDGPGLHPLLRDHLEYALTTWGFDDVR